MLTQKHEKTGSSWENKLKCIDAVQEQHISPRPKLLSRGILANGLRSWCTNILGMQVDFLYHFKRVDGNLEGSYKSCSSRWRKKTNMEALRGAIELKWNWWGQLQSTFKSFPESFPVESFACADPLLDIIKVVIRPLSKSNVLFVSLCNFACARERSFSVVLSNSWHLCLLLQGQCNWC